MKRIWGVECQSCKKRLFSFHIHDFKYCGCSAETFVDGGRSYLRYGWNTYGFSPRKIYWCKRDGNYAMITAPIKKIKDRFPY